MTTEEKIISYSNRAQTLISELTDIIELQVRQGLTANTELNSVVELLDFHETINNYFCPWTDLQKETWIEFFEIRYNMIDIPATITEQYVIPVVVATTTGNGVSQGTLDAAVAALEIQIDSLSASVDSWLGFNFNDLVPQSLIDDTAEAKAGAIANAGAIATLGINIATNASGLATHIADNTKHLQSGERDTWNAKVSQTELAAGLGTKANTSHSHEQSDITGLSTALNNLQQQITDLPTPEPGEDGASPVIVIGTVEEGVDVSVEIDEASTPLNRILNFTIPRGNDGNGLDINATGTIEDRDLYDAEADGFIFVDTVNSEAYVLNSAVWSLPIPLKGLSGWTPVIAIANISPTIAVHKVIDWIFGTGDKPWPSGSVEDLYLSASGYTNLIAQAINIKGDAGPTGDIGFFKIDEAGADRSIYDFEVKNFAFLDTITGMFSYKLSEADADWSPLFQWKGDQGIAGKTILSGTEIPTTEGVDGDFYLRTSTSDLYGPKTGGAWGAGVSLLGSVESTSDVAEGTNLYYTEERVSANSDVVANTAKVTDANFVFNQPLPSALWSITHPLNKYTSVTVSDTSGNIVQGDISYVSETELTITFSSAFAGKAYLN